MRHNMSLLRWKWGLFHQSVRIHLPALNNRHFSELAWPDMTIDRCNCRFHFNVKEPGF